MSNFSGNSTALFSDDSFFPPPSPSEASSSSPRTPHDPFQAAFPTSSRSDAVRTNGSERRSTSPRRKPDERDTGTSQDEPYETVQELLSGSSRSPGQRSPSLHPSSAALTPTRPILSKPTRLASTSSIPILTTTSQPILPDRPHSATGQYEHDHSSLPPHPHPGPSKPVTPLSKKNIFLSTSPFHPSIHTHPADSFRRSQSPSFINSSSDSQTHPIAASPFSNNPSLNLRNGHTRSPSLPSQLPSSQHQLEPPDYFQHPRAHSTSAQRVELTMEDDPFGAFPAPKPTPPTIVIKDLSDRGESSSESESDSEEEDQPYISQHHHHQHHHRLSQSHPQPTSSTPSAPLQSLAFNGQPSRHPLSQSASYITRKPVPSPPAQPSPPQSRQQAPTQSNHNRRTSSTASSPQLPNHQPTFTSPASDTSTVLPSDHLYLSPKELEDAEVDGADQSFAEGEGFEADETEQEGEGNYLTRPLGLLALSQALSAANDEVAFLRSTVREITGMVLPALPVGPTRLGDGRVEDEGIELEDGRRIGVEEIDELSGSEARELLKSLARAPLPTSSSQSSSHTSHLPPQSPRSSPPITSTTISLIHRLHGLVSPSTLHIPPSNLHTLFTDERLHALGDEMERWGRVVRRVEDEERRARARGGTL